MEGENEMVQEVSDAPAESEVVGGEPQGSTETAGESVAGDTKGEPSGEGLFDGMTPEKLHKSYKSLQKEYTKTQEAIKKLEKYGGPDQLVGWADYLSNHPGFAEWVKTQQNQNVLGAQEVDEDQKRALDAVRQIAESVVEQRVKDLYQNEVAPLSETYKQQMLQGHFESMDKTYGSDWHELRDVMSELSEQLPPSVQDRPTYEDIEDLYFKALRKTGKMQTYAKKMYEKELVAKKAKATEKPAATPASMPQNSSSIAEAFAVAKRMHNMG